MSPLEFRPTSPPGENLLVLSRCPASTFALAQCQEQGYIVPFYEVLFRVARSRELAPGFHEFFLTPVSAEKRSRREPLH